MKSPEWKRASDPEATPARARVVPDGTVQRLEEKSAVPVVPPATLPTIIGPVPGAFLGILTARAPCIMMIL
jgi:hypothetical protein